MSADEPRMIQLAPAPVFTCRVGGPSLATVYGSHYSRLVAVLDAARTGNRLLIELAVKHQDAHGSNDSEPYPAAGGLNQTSGEEA